MFAHKFSDFFALIKNNKIIIKKNKIKIYSEKKTYDQNIYFFNSVIFLGHWNFFLISNLLFLTKKNNNKMLFSKSDVTSDAIGKKNSRIR